LSPPSLRVSSRSRFRPALTNATQYGHGNFENSSALSANRAPLLTAVYIIYEAFYRLFFHSFPISSRHYRDPDSLVALAIDMTLARA